MVTRALSLLLALAGFAFLGSAVAQPDLTRRMAATVADTGVAGYRFESLAIPARQGGHGYRLRVAVPERAPPRAGFPVAWLLDGNAALMDLQADTLQKLAASPSPPVLVFVAHDNDLRIDADARAYDYTPRRPGGEEAQRDPMGTRRNGGADEFLALLVGEARARVAALAPLDAQRHALWGHSYGGVFVLHVLFTRPQSFACYGAADPSLWWGDGYLLKEAANAVAWTSPAPRLRLWFGKADAVQKQPEREATAARGSDAVDAMRRARQSVPADAGERLAERLRMRGMQVDVEVLAGLSHGQTLGASLPSFLDAVAGAAP